MSQTLLFLAFFLAAATFCVAAALGFLLVFSKREFGSQQKLQKLFGITLLLVAVQLMLFFQKVEVLMVRDLLFCEQELSRDEVASAIGTNRTFAAAYNCSPSDYRKNSVSHSLTESSVEE